MIFIAIKKLLVYLCLSAIFAIGLGYGFAKWALADSPKTEKTTETKQINSMPKVKKENFKNPEEVKKATGDEMKARGYDNAQIMALDGMKVTKPEFTEFPDFVEIMTDDFNGNNDLVPTITASYVYSKYLMSNTKDKSIKKDALAVKEQSARVIKSDRDPSEVKKLRDLFNQLHKKYN